jgi:glycosyltransferase involved in cell wall biosynthesis
MSSSGGRGGVIFVHTKDMIHGAGGGEVLVATNVKLARRAGFETHLVCGVASGALRSSPEHQEPFGAVTELLNPARFLGRRSEPRSVDIPWFSRPTAAAVRAIGHEIASRHGGPVIVEACSVWSGIAVDAVAVLRKDGIDARSIGRFYGWMPDEFRSKVAGLTAGHGWRAGRDARLEQLWAPLLARWERRGYLQCDVAISNYRSVVALLERYVAERRHVRIEPYTSGLDGADAPRTRREIERPLRVVVVSRHDPRKGIDVAIAAAQLLRDRGCAVEFRLVGGGMRIADHRAMAVARGVAGMVDIRGRVDSVAEHYRWADAFLLPSHEEHSGSLSLIEAARHGCAILSTDVGGLSEDVSKPDDGVLVPPAAPDRIADVLARWAGDPDDLLRLQLGARRLFVRRFDPAVTEAAALDLYTSLGARHR